MKSLSLILATSNMIKWPAGFVVRYLPVWFLLPNRALCHVGFPLGPSGFTTFSFRSGVCHKTFVPFLRQISFFTVFSNTFWEFFSYLWAVKIAVIYIPLSSHHLGNGTSGTACSQATGLCFSPLTHAERLIKKTLNISDSAFVCSPPKTNPGQDAFFQQNVWVSP